MLETPREVPMPWGSKSEISHVCRWSQTCIPEETKLAVRKGDRGELISLLGSLEEPSLELPGHQEIRPYPTVWGWSGDSVCFMAPGGVLYPKLAEN